MPTKLRPTTRGKTPDQFSNCSSAYSVLVWRHNANQAATNGSGKAPDQFSNCSKTGHYNPGIVSAELVFDRVRQTCRLTVLLIKLVLPSPSVTLTPPV